MPGTPRLRQIRFEIRISFGAQNNEKKLRACGTQTIKNIFHAFAAQNIKNFFTPLARRTKTHRDCNTQNIKKEKSRLRH